MYCICIKKRIIINNVELISKYNTLQKALKWDKCASLKRVQCWVSLIYESELLRDGPTASRPTEPFNIPNKHKIKNLNNKNLKSMQ